MNSLCLFSNLTSSEWASWAQFLATVLVLPIAIYVPYKQRKYQIDDMMRLREQDERALGISCFADLEHLIAQIDKYSIAMESLTSDPSSFRFEHLSQLRLGQYPDIGAISADWHRFKVAPNCLQNLIHFLNEHSRRITIEEGDWLLNPENAYANKVPQIIENNINRLGFLKRNADATHKYFLNLIRPKAPKIVKVKLAN